MVDLLQDIEAQIAGAKAATDEAERRRHPRDR